MGDLARQISKANFLFLMYTKWFPMFCKEMYMYEKVAHQG